MPTIYIKDKTVHRLTQIAEIGQFDSRAEALDDALRFVLWLLRRDHRALHLPVSRLWTMWQMSDEQIETRGGHNGGTVQRD